MILEYFKQWIISFWVWLTMPGPGLWVGIGLVLVLCLVLQKGGLTALRECPTDRIGRALLACVLFTAGMLPFVIPPEALFNPDALLSEAERVLRTQRVRPAAGAILAGLALIITWPRRIRALALSPFSQTRRALTVGFIWLVIMALIFFSVRASGTHTSGGGDAAQAGGGASMSVPLPSEVVFENFEQPQDQEGADAVVILFLADGQSAADDITYAKNMRCVVRDERYGEESTIVAKNFDHFMELLDVTLVAARGRRDQAITAVAVDDSVFPGEYVLSAVSELAARYTWEMPSGVRAAFDVDNTSDFSQSSPYAGEAGYKLWLDDVRKIEALRKQTQ